MDNEYFVFVLNNIDTRSIGYIARAPLELANKNGFDYLIALPHKSDKPNTITISQQCANSFIGRCFDHFYNFFLKPADGFKSPTLSRKLCRIMESYRKRYKSMVVHIHGLHYIPYSMVSVLKYIKKKNIPCIYTFHDFYPITGGCLSFEQYGCQGFKTQCKNCKFGYKRSHKLSVKKVNLLSNIDDLVIVPVSKYCEDRIKETKLANKRIELINVETDVKPIVSDISLRKQLGIDNNDKVIISVCAYWCYSKGVDFLYKISERLPNDYKLIVVGHGFESNGHNNIISIPFVDRVTELPTYLSISDVFVSVTQGDNFPLVLVEAQICGLPIVGFGHGGTPEEITEKSGIMVGKDNNIDKLVETLVYVCENRPFNKNDCIKSGERFTSGFNNKKYLSLYKEMVSD